MDYLDLMILENREDYYGGNWYVSKKSNFRRC